MRETKYCKDCINSDVCAVPKSKYSNGKEDSCLFFKNKAEWVHSPCDEDNFIPAKEQAKKPLLNEEK